MRPNANRGLKDDNYQVQPRFSMVSQVASHFLREKIILRVSLILLPILAAAMLLTVLFLGISTRPATAASPTGEDNCQPDAVQPMLFERVGRGLDNDGTRTSVDQFA